VRSCQSRRRSWTGRWSRWTARASRISATSGRAVGWSTTATSSISGGTATACGNMPTSSGCSAPSPHPHLPRAADPGRRSRRPSRLAPLVRHFHPPKARHFRPSLAPVNGLQQNHPDFSARQRSSAGGCPPEARGRAFESRRAHSGTSSPASRCVMAGFRLPPLPADLCQSLCQTPAESARPEGQPLHSALLTRERPSRSTPRFSSRMSGRRGILRA
jgi:hypothetical protein